MSVSKNLFKSSIIYFIGQVFSKIISFLLLPLYTYYLDPDAYGYYNLTLSILGVVVPVIFMEIWTGTLRYAIERKDEEGKRIIVNNAIIIGLVSLFAYSLLFMICAIIFKFDFPIWIYIYSFMWILQLFILSVARAYGANTLYAVSGVVSVIVNVACTVVAVMITKGNIASLYFGMSVSFLSQVYMVNRKFRIFRHFTFKDFDKDLISSMVHFSLPLCFNSVMYWMMEGFNMMVMSAMLDLTATGIYSAASKIAVALNLVVSVFGLSWQETIFKIEDQEERAAVYNTGVNMMIKVVSVGVVVLLPLIAVLFPYIIGVKFTAAHDLVPLMLLVIFTNALVTLLSSCFAAEKYNRGNLWAKVVSGSVNVIIILTTIQTIGIYGSALGLILGNAAGIVVQILLLKKYITIRPNRIYLLVFIVLFIPSVVIYIRCSLLTNILWFVAVGIFALIYLKDFLFKILKLTVGLRRE